MATQASTPAEKDDDFFESWDKAKATPSPRPSKPSSPAPPSIGVGAAAGAAKPAATGPRTVTSSSLRTGGAKPAARPMKLGSKLGGSKLGAKKAAAPIDFEEAQRKAREEEERIKRLGYDKKKEEEEAAALKQREEEERRKNQAAGVSNSRSATPLSGSSRKKAAAEEEKPAPVRLGFGQIASTAPPPSKAAQKSRAFEDDANDSDASGSARERFGNQKSISSDMYFGRGNYDPSASAEAKTRLQNFQGATAISSNAYFGREEEDDDDLHGGEGLLGIEGNETYQALDRNVRDMAQKVMSDPNVQQITDQIRQGALRLGDWMASLESR